MKSRRASPPKIPFFLSLVTCLSLLSCVALTSPVFAAEIGHYYTSHDALITKSCASGTWQEVTEYTIDSGSAHANFVAGNKYLIVINFSILIGTDTDQNAMARVLHGTDPFSDATYRHENRTELPVHVGHGYHYWTVWEAVAGEDIRVEVTQPTSTPTDVFTEEYEAFVINLDGLTEDADWFYQAETHSGDLPDTWTPGAGITFDGRNSDWLVLGLCRYVLDGTTSYYGIRIEDVTAGQSYSTIGYLSADTDDYRPVMNMVGLTNVGSDHTVRVAAMSTEANMHDWSHSKIFALNLDKFVDHWTGYSTIPVSLSSLNWIYEVYGNSSYSASQTGDVLIWSQEVADVGEINKAIYSRIQVNGQTVPGGHQDAKRALAHGDGDESGHHRIYLGSLNQGSNDIDIDMSENVDVFPAPVIDIHSLCVFSMEKDPCDTPQPPQDPSPLDGAEGVAIDIDLDWADCDHADSYDVYFGTSSSPPLVTPAGQTASIYDPGTLEHATTYYWKIEAKNSCGSGISTTGPVWSFTTVCLSAGTPDSPAPINDATDVSINADLDWSDCSNAASYEVYFGTSSSPFPSQADTTNSHYALPTLEYETQYYWQVKAKNACGDTTAGEVWNFVTAPCPFPGVPSNPSPADDTLADSVWTDLDWADSSDTAYYDVYFGTASSPPKVGSTFGATSSWDPGLLEMGETYYWQIVAQNNCPNSTPGPVWSFTVCATPGAPSNPSPADDAENVDLLTLAFNGLDWADSVNTDSYDVYFGTSSSNPQFRGNTTESDFNVPSPECGKHYYWKIEAKNSCGGSTWGPLWDFSTCPNPSTPGTPTPSNGAANVLLEPDRTLAGGLDWSDCSDATSYMIYLGTSSSDPQYRGNRTVSQYDPGPLEYGTTYYWKIIAQNDCACSAEGGTWTFTTECPAAVAPSAPSPENHAMPEPIPSELTWTGWDEATSYYVYLGTSPDPPLVTPFGVTETSYSPGLLQWGTTYYWKVEARNSCDSAMSPVWDFTPCQTPGTPASPSPADDASSVNLSYIAFDGLDWSDCSNAASYTVYFGTSPSNPVYYTNVTVSTCRVTPGYVTCGNTYYWKIVANNSCGKSKAGEIWNFSTCVCPGTPGLPSPPNNALDVPPHCDDATVELQWSACDDADDYEVLLSTDSTFPCAPYPGECPVQKHYPATNSCTANVAYGTTYYWKVTAFNDCWGVTVGPVWTFVTQPVEQCASPGMPGSPSPAVGATGLPVTGNLLEWSEPSCAHYYEVYLGTSPDPPFADLAAGNSYNVPGLLDYDTTYYWKIVSVNSWCESKTEGPVWHFATAPTDPPRLYWTGDPGYGNDGVEPNTGDSGATFEFRVSYTDPDDDPPTTKEVWIDLDDSGSYEADEKFDMTEVDSGDNNHVDGKDYTCSRAIDHPLVDDPLGGSDGNLDYRFYFRDWRDPAAGTPARDHAFSVNVPPNEVPSLAWTGDSGYMTDGVEPDTGASGSTFTFRVEYSDQDDNPPAIKEIWIDLDDSGSYGAGEKFDMTKIGSGEDYENGEKFTYGRSITHPLGVSDGNLNYRFYFKDWGASAAGDPAADHALTVGCPTPGTPGNPSPAEGAPGEDIWNNLDWADADHTDSYDVYFGTSSSDVASSAPSAYSGNTASSSYAVALDPFTTYYWKIEAKNNCGNSQAGPVWSFTTGCAVPGIPAAPSPGNTSANVATDVDLSWSDPGEYADAYDVYFGTSSSDVSSGAPSTYQGNTTSNSYDPGLLEYATDYYWRIASTNTCGNAEGPVWHFATEPGPGGTEHYVDPDNAERARHPFVTPGTAAPTISQAVSACSSGTVYVRKGVYNATVTMKSNVDVIGTDETWNPSDAPAFDDSPTLYGGASAVVLFQGPLSNCKLQGFIVSGGQPGRGQIELDGETDAVTNVSIEHCSLGGLINGAIIYMHGAVAPTISNCTIQNSSFALISSKPGGQLQPTGFPIIIRGNVLHGGGQGGLGAGIRLNGNWVGAFDLTIDGGNDIALNTDAGISLRDMGSQSVVTIDGNSIHDNGSAPEGRAGIDIRGVKGVTITRNEIYNNTMAGIVIRGDSSATIGAGVSTHGPVETIQSQYGNDIHDNYAGISFGGGDNPLDVSGGPFVIRGNEIYTNEGAEGAKGAGIAIRARVVAEIFIIRQNNIYDNLWGGISIQNTCTAEILQNNIHHQDKRGGIHTVAGAPTLTIKQNKVHHNQGATFGGGIDVRHAYGTISNNLVYHNARGGIRFYDRTEEIFHNTVVYNGNEATDRGGGIIYDDGDGLLNSPPSGTASADTVIRNNICAYNEKAGLRVGGQGYACPDNPDYYPDDPDEAAEPDGKNRDYNLLYGNYWWNNWFNRENAPDCGWPNLNDMSCVQQQYGGCGAYFDFSQSPPIVLDGPSDKMCDPQFVDMDNHDYHLAPGSSAENAADDGGELGAYGGAELEPLRDEDIPDGGL